jgi:hypothetical protein
MAALATSRQPLQVETVMASRVGYLVASVLLPGLAFAPNASADDFADFRIPEHRVVDWRASLSAEGGRSSFGNEGLMGTRSRRIYGSFSSAASWLWDSDPSRTAISLDAGANGSGDWTETHEAPFYFPGFARSRWSELRRVGERWGTSLSHRRYPWSAPIGFELSVFGTAAYHQAWIGEGSDTYDPRLPPRVSLFRYRDERWNYQYLVGGQATLGVGRVRDATGVYDAMLLESRLEEAGVLARPLSAPTRRALAELLTLRASYVALHDRGAKDLWREVERLLVADGALDERGLDGYAILRVGEPALVAWMGPGFAGLPTSPVARPRGTFAGLALVADHSRTIDRAEFSSYSQTIDDGVPNPPSSSAYGVREVEFSDNILGGATIEHHRPIGARWQADASGRLLFPLRDDVEGVRLSTGGNLAWIVDARWLAQARVLHARNVDRDTDGRTLQDAWNWDYGIAVTYFIEDRLALSLSADERQTHLRGSYYGSARSSRDNALRLSLDYRLSGRFMAPGFQLPSGL